MALGITLDGAPGLGDKLIFTSFPENFFKNTGEKVIDLDGFWGFDFNPYVLRDQEPTEVLNLWSEPRREFGLEDFIKKPVHFSIAERTLELFPRFKTFLRHPRLYRWENLVCSRPLQVSLHISGTTQPPLSTEIIER